MASKDFECNECAASYTLYFAPNDDEQRPIFCPFCGDMDDSIEDEEEEVELNFDED